MVMRLSLYRVNDVPYVLQELFKIAGIWFFSFIYVVFCVMINIVLKKGYIEVSILYGKKDG